MIPTHFPGFSRENELISDPMMAVQPLVVIRSLEIH